MTLSWVAVVLLGLAIDVVVWAKIQRVWRAWRRARRLGAPHVAWALAYRDSLVKAAAAFEALSEPRYASVAVLRERMGWRFDEDPRRRDAAYEALLEVIWREEVALEIIKPNGAEMCLHGLDPHAGRDPDMFDPVAVLDENGKVVDVVPAKPDYASQLQKAMMEPITDGASVVPLVTGGCGGDAPAAPEYVNAKPSNVVWAPQLGLHISIGDDGREHVVSGIDA